MLKDPELGQHPAAGPETPMHPEIPLDHRLGVGVAPPGASAAGWAIATAGWAWACTGVCAAARHWTAGAAARFWRHRELAEEKWPVLGRGRGPCLVARFGSGCKV